MITDKERLDFLQINHATLSEQLEPTCRCLQCFEWALEINHIEYFGNNYSIRSAIDKAINEAKIRTGDKND